jgi:hypothetical protein
VAEKTTTIQIMYDMHLNDKSQCVSLLVSSSPVIVMLMCESSAKFQHWMEYASARYSVTNWEEIVTKAVQRSQHKFEHRSIWDRDMNPAASALRR